MLIDGLEQIKKCNFGPKRFALLMKKANHKIEVKVESSRLEVHFVMNRIENYRKKNSQIF